jgi:hypothetical protein
MFLNIRTALKFMCYKKFLHTPMDWNYLYVCEKES